MKYQCIECDDRLPCFFDDGLNNSTSPVEICPIKDGTVKAFWTTIPEQSEPKQKETKMTRNELIESVEKINRYLFSVLKAAEDKKE